MLKDLSITLLTAPETSTTANRIITIAEGLLQDQPFHTAIINLIKEEIANLNKSMSRNLSSQFTELLFNKDSRRDAAFIGFRDYCKASTQRVSTQLVEAATTVLDIIKRNGWTLYRYGYTDETNALNLMIRELDSTANAALLETFGAASWYLDLKAAQSEFEAAYNQKVTVEAQEDYTLLREAKAKLGGHLNLLLNNIDILSEIGGIIGINDVIEQINEVITDVMATARARRTRLESEDETPAE